MHHLSLLPTLCDAVSAPAPAAATPAARHGPSERRYTDVMCVALVLLLDAAANVTAFFLDLGDLGSARILVRAE